MKINIKIVQGKNEIYVEGNEPQEIIDKLDDINKIVEKLGGISFLSSSTIPTNVHVNQTLLQDTTPSELISQTKPKNVSDRIMLMVYYLFKQGTQTVNANDMRNIFKQILEPDPANWGAMMNNLVTRGFLTKSQPKDKIRAWSITRTGIDYVEKELLKRGVNESQ